MNALLKVGALVILLIVVGLAVFGFYLDQIIKSGIEAVGPQITGTAVKLDAVKVSLFSGKGRIKGLVIGNPKGFQTPSAFRLGDASVRVDLKSALSDKLIIEEILIDGPEITYEAASSGSNIDRIQQNVAAFGQSPGAVQAAPEPPMKKDPTQKLVQINDFILKNGKVTMSASMIKGNPITIPFPDIHLHEIGKEPSGMTVQKALTEVFTAINQSAIQTVAGSGQLLEKGIEAAGEAAKSIEGGAGKSGSKAVEDLKGLFGN